MLGGVRYGIACAGLTRNIFTLSMLPVATTIRATLTDDALQTTVVALLP